MQERAADVSEKWARTCVPIHDLLRRRWSPRAFSEQPLAPQTLLSVLEAARWAPSSLNEQPWRLIVGVKGDGTHEAVLGCLTERNRSWARRAPLLLLAVARLTFADDGTPNRHAAYDVGQAIAHLTVQATAAGLVVHQMAGFSVAEARARFQIPEGFDPLAVVAIGFLGDPGVLPEALRERERAPRERKPLEELVFGSQWETPAPLLASR